ncbi:MAG: glycoside hydrolase family 3 C-terminal domain-containing protein [Faecalibacterium sp.]|jgi:beta-glucosidase|nr:glycoside hydrolase family 3 C-terminal domain-containing protein [Faecalibacterium sp.]
MEISQRAAELVGQMTLEEKAALCAGSDFWHNAAVSRLGLAAHRVSDGPHGLRKPLPEESPMNTGKSVPATSFPTASASACSFDRDLLHRMGEALGEKCVREDVSVLLGPGVNIKRSPLCGRNFEYFSEDPYLAGELAAEIVRGVQSRDTGTSLKHFAANNQETGRMVCDSVVDERTLREIYLSAFETVVKKAQPWTVMCSYNKINGVHASDNKWLLTDVLRTEWGFEGAVISDWGAVNDRVAGILAGLDLEMPHTTGDTPALLVEAVQNGVLPLSELDKCAQRVTELILKEQKPRRASHRTDSDDNELAREIAVQSAVLLKNEEALLPLDSEKKIAFIGRMAKQPRYQGSGSSHITPAFQDNVFEAAVAAGLLPIYAEGYPEDSSTVDETMIATAVAAAKAADVAVVFAGLPEEYESEGFDRTTMDMPESHNRLIAAVAEANPNTVVVLQCGSPVTLPWRDSVRAILLMYLAGQASGNATLDLLFGKESPCGKLAETWPETLESVPSTANFPGEPKAVQYREGLFVGYRYYDAANCPVAYPFGYGLSYTQFAYSDLAVRALGRGRYKVTVNVQNVGSRAAREIVQLYVARKGESKIVRAPKELKGFEKVALNPGESAMVEFRLEPRSFSYFNIRAQSWCIEGGTYQILAGATSRDLPLCFELELEGDGKEALVAKQYAGLTDYRAPAVPFAPSAEQFTLLLGHPLPADTHPKDEPFTSDNTLDDIRRTRVGKMLLRQVKKNMTVSGGDASTQRMMDAMMYTSPLRSLRMFAGMTWTQVDGLVEMANGHFFRGLCKLKARKPSPAQAPKARK